MAEKTPGKSTPIAKCVDRQVHTVRGRVASLTYPPQSHMQVVKAALRDETGTLLVTWLGRKTLGGVNVGDTLEVTGIISLGSGHPQMINPRYQVLSNQTA